MLQVVEQNLDLPEREESVRARPAPSPQPLEAQARRTQQPCPMRHVQAGAGLHALRQAAWSRQEHQLPRSQPSQDPVGSAKSGGRGMGWVPGSWQQAPVLHSVSSGECWGPEETHPPSSYLRHHIVGPDVGGQGGVPFALPLRGPQQGGAEDRGQVVEGHFVDRLLLGNPAGIGSA